MEKREIPNEKPFDQVTEDLQSTHITDVPIELNTPVNPSDDPSLKIEQNGEQNTEVAESKEEEIEEILSEEVKEQKHKDAITLKDEGNVLFKNAEYEKAVGLYTQGLQTCPKCFSKTLAILYSNRAACHMKMDESEKGIEDCTQALTCDEHYTKARIRRAQMYETTDKLDEALKDYNEVLSYDRANKIALEAAMRLPKQIEERNEKLKEEMMGKLKDLGNMCLKPFGLSTENFKFQQDPNTGGYSMNFQK